MNTSNNVGGEESLEIQWFIKKHLPRVLEIDKGSFLELAWNEDNFKEVLADRKCIGLVAVKNDNVIGFIIYKLHDTRLEIINFAVCPEHRYQQVGSYMIRMLIKKLSSQRRNEISLEIRESNLSGQLFFQKQGFKAVEVLRSYYEDTDESAYSMLYRLNSGIGPGNRISKYIEDMK